MWAEHNSTFCLAAGTCQPLGGHSVWATFPPLPAAGSDSKSIIMVAAGMDGNAIFHDQIEVSFMANKQHCLGDQIIMTENCCQGAEAPISGLVALLAAAEILGNGTSAAAWHRRIMFAAFAGEPWGYMGSKRFLWELHTTENSTKGLRLADIEQV